MKHLYQLFFVCSLFFMATATLQAQCTLTASVNDNQVTCGECVTLSVFGQGQGQIVFQENFNSGSPVGWAFTNQAQFNNPCSPGGVNGTPHLWMGNTSGVPRILRTVNYNLTTATAGVTICFDMLFATQGDAAPCEGPDEPDEGIYLQYSTNNGTTWNTIHYFDPNGGYDPMLTNWNNWCFQLPPAAITAATSIRWFQDNDSGQDYDHWGIDNVRIYFNDPTYNITWGHDGYSYGAGSGGGANPTQVCPQNTTTYTVTMTNGATTCTSSVTVNVTDPTIVVNAGPDPAPICPGQCVTLNAADTRVIMSPAKTPTYANAEITGITTGFGAESSITINVQGLNMTNVLPNSITQVCIQNLTFFGFNFFPPQQVTIGNLILELECPDGTRITLVPSGVTTGTNLAGYSNTCFVPSGGANIATGAAPYSGNWAPNQPFNNLAGCTANGEWNLIVRMNTPLGFGTGFFFGWNISFDDPEISVPAIISWSPTTNMTGSNTLTPTVCPTATTTYTLTAADPAGCTSATDQVTVTVGPCCPMTISATPTNGACGNLGSATVTINNAPVTPLINWSNGTSSATITNLTSGAYTVTVTAGAGCTQTASVTITNATTSPPTIANAQQVCNGAGTAYTVTLTLNGTTPITVTGAAGSLAGNIWTSNPITAGTFPTLTITNVCGSITITPNVSCGPPVPCNSSSGCFGPNLVVNGNFESFNPATPFATFTSDYDYTPCPGVCLNTVTNLPVLCAYDFSVSTNANACNGDWTSQLTDHTSGSGNMMLVDFPNGNVAPNNRIWCQTINLAPGTNYCFGGYFANILPAGSNQPLPIFGFTSNGTLLGTSPSLPENEQWQFYGTQFNSGAGGNVTLCITNQNFGFVGFDLAIDDISVRASTGGTQPSAVNDNVSFCTGNTNQVINVLANDTPTGGAITSLTIESAPPFSDGTVSNVNLATGTVTFTPAPGFSGSTSFNYQICNASGCCAVATVTITPSAPPPAAISGNLGFCTGGSTVLTASGGGTYVWSTGATTAAITVSTPGGYSVTVTNAGGCTASASTIVTLNSISPVNMPPATICQGGAPVTLNPGVYNSYIWSTGATTQTISVSPATTTTYTVTVTNATGCSAIGSSTVTVNNITPPSFPPATYCPGSPPVTLNAGSYNAYSWSVGATSASITVSPTSTATYGVTVSGAGGCTASSTVTVTVNTLTPPTLAPASLCAGGAPVTLNAGTYNAYSWSTGATTQTISVNPASTALYSVTVTGAGGCTASASTTVTVNTATPPTLAPAAICAGGAPVTLNAGAGYTNYSWSNSSINQSISVSPINTTTYTVTVTATGGCTATASATVTVNTAAPPVMPPQTTCTGGNSVALNAGGGYTAYSWSTGAATQTISVSPASNTTYTVTVTGAGGCTASGSVAVNISNPPPFTIASSPICVGNSVTLNAGGPFSSYSWSTGVNTQSISVSPLATTTYTVTVADANNCTSVGSGTVTVNASPTAGITGSTTFCPGSSATLTATPAGAQAYSWSNGAATASITVNTPGLYNVTVTNAGGCTGSAQVSVTQNASLSPGIGGDLTLCPGETTNLDAGSGFTQYTWSTGATTQTITTGTAGTYSVTVSDAGSCTGSTSVIVTTNPTPPVSISGNPICVGGTATLTATAGYLQYTWSTGSFAQSISANTAGAYSVTITDSSGCTASASYTLNINTGTVPTISGALSFCAGSSTTLDAGAGYLNYIWSTGSNTQTTTAVAAGTYFVTTTDANGCTGSNSVVVSVNSAATPVISGNTNVCPGSSTIISTSGFSSYSWNTGATNATINPTPATTTTYTVTATDANGCTASNSVTVNVLTPPLPDITGIAAFCAGENSTLDAGAGFNQYLWSTGSTAQTITVATGGTYTVTVADGVGCTGTDSFVVTVNNNPTVIIGGSTTFCIGNNTTLDAGAGFTNYLWNTGATTQTLSVSTGATYSVTVTDANGCTNTDQLAVTESSSLSPIIIGNLPFCTGNSATLNAGSGFAQYLWNTGASTQTLAVTAAGIYEVTVTDAGGCTGTASATANVNPNPAPTITGLANICAGQTATLDAGLGFASYTWSNGAATQIINTTTSGTYSVTVTDANGCTGTDNFVLTVGTSLSPVISGNLDFCQGASTTLDAGSGYATYTWSNGATSQTITTGTSGIYFVTVTDAGGCTGETSATVTVSSNPVVNIAGTNNVCTGETSVLDAGAGFNTYSWSTGANTQTLSVSTSGTYSVTVSNASGCTGSDSFGVTVNPNPTTTITGSTSFCTGSSSSLDAGAGFNSYSWSTGANTQNITVGTSGTYSVTVSNASGCTGTASITVTESSSLSPSISGNLAVCQGASTTLDAGSGYASYSWSNTANGQTTTVSTSGTYSVTVSDASGCTGTASAVVTVNNNPVPDVSGPASICIGQTATLNAGAGYTAYLWGNGSNGQTLAATTSGTYSVTVTDANGCTGTDNFTLTVGTSLSPIISGNLDICAGETTTLDAGAGYASYTWSTGANTQTITVNTSGIYFVTVSDATGCTGETSQTVTLSSNPAVVIAGANNICTGETATLDAGAGFNSYIWSNGEATQTISVTTSGAYSVTVSNAAGCSGTDSFTVAVNANPATTITGSTTFCTGSSTALNAGAGFNSYIWSNGEVTQSITVSTAGTYSVTVSNAFGCTGADDITVTESASLSPAISGDLDLCQGETTTLDAGAGYATYSWSNTAGGQTTAVSTSGAYTVTVSDAGGCTGTASAVVTVNNNPVPDVSGPASICIGQTATLNAGAGYTAYLWGNGSNGQTLAATTSGTYSVTVTDANGCTGTDNFTLTVGTSLSPIISGNLDICAGETTTLDAGAGYASYTWSTGANTQTITVNTSGIYFVTVSDATGCTGETSQTVTLSSNPAVVIAGANNICTGETATLDAGAGFNSYIWSNGEATQTISVTTSGAYSVTVSNAAGCSGTDSFTVAVNANPATTITGSTTFCTGSSTALNAGAGFNSYIWSNGEVTQSITVSTAGTYSVTVSNAFGCTGADDITVTESASLSPAISGDLDLCQGETTTLDAGAGYATYSWSNTAGGQTTAVSTSGAYTVTVSDAGGCTGTASAVVTVNNNPVPDVSGPASICIGETATLNAGAGYTAYLWGNGSNGQTLAATTSGTYSVTVTDANGCTGTDSFDLVAIDCSTCTPPNAPIVSGNLTVCAGEVNTTAFTATAAAGMVINWYNAPTGGTLLGTGADYVPATPGTYYAQTATLADPTCVSTFTPATLQSDLVSVTLTANPTATATGGTVQLTATAASTLGTITSYVWTTSGPDALSCTDCPNPQVSVSQTTLFTVTAQDSFGCSATASVQVVVLPQGNVVLIPNAFSPNGDGVNDLFRVSGVNVESMELFIYNRWGVEMFAASGAPNLAWDGTYKGTDQEIGVYVYYANITFTNGETETYKGNVTLIR